MIREAHSIRLSHWVHRSLLGGLILSAIVILIGLVVAFGDGQPRPELKPPAFGKLAGSAVHGDGVALLDLGLVLLMLTPVLRVAVLGVGWTLGRQWRFAIVAACVLALLIASLLLGTG